MANEYTADNERIISEIDGFQNTDIGISVENLFAYYEEHENEIDFFTNIWIKR